MGVPTLEATDFRSLDRVALSALVGDANAPRDGTTPVIVGLEWAVNPDPEVDSESLAWRAATLVDDRNVIAATRDGVSAELVWDTSADTSPEGPLRAREADTNGDGAPDRSVLDYTEGLRLRIVATDETGRSQTSSPTPRFTVGNAPPVVRLLRFPEGVESVGGLVAIEFSLADTPRDLAAVELEFATDTDPTWKRAAIAQGTTSNLSPGSSFAYVLVWNSEAQSDPDPTTPQGLGDQNAEVRVRMRGFESIAMLESGVQLLDFGAWSDPIALPQVTNQNPPLVDNLVSIRADEHGGSSIVPISYRVTDEESEPVDVRFEFSFDRGRSWERCRELLVPASEGTEKLASLPTARGGVEHLFFWDAGGVRLQSETSTRIRVVYSDGNSPERSTVLTLGNPVSATNDDYGQRIGPLPTAQFVDLVSADFNRDSLGDFAGSSSAGVDVYRARLGTSGIEYDNVQTIGTPGAGCNAQAISTADFNVDGRIDLAFACQNALTTSENRVFVALGESSGDFAAPTPLVTGRAWTNDLSVGDIDADGVADIVAVSRGSGASGSVSIFYGERGPGGPTGTFESAIFYDGLSEDLGFIELGDLDGNGTLELVVMSDGPSSETIEVHSNQASTTRTTPFTLARTRTIGGPSQGLGRGESDRVIAVSGDEVSLLGMSNEEDRDLVQGYRSRSNANIQFRDFVLADVTNDGVDDLLFWAIASSPFDDAVFIAEGFEASGQLELRAPALFFETDAAGQARALAVGDIDRDRQRDLVINDSLGGNGRTTTLLRAPQRTPGATYAVRLLDELVERVGGEGPVPPSIEDFDHDSVYDLLVASGAELRVLRGEKSNRLFAPRYELVDVIAFDGINAVTAVHTVLGWELWVATSNGIRRLLDAAGTLAFQEIDSLFVGSVVSQIEVADFDGDGSSDLIAIVDGEAHQALLGSQGEATFSALGLSSGIVQALVDDVDADGMLDIAVATDSQARVFLGQTASSFAGQAGVSTSFVRGLRVADITGDGVLDLVIGRFDSVFGRGQADVSGPTALFDTPVDLGPPSMSGSPIPAVDLNEDGVLDFFADYDQGVSLYETVSVGGRATSTFAASAEFASLNDNNRFVSQVALADFDSDGTVDLLDQRTDSFEQAAGFAVWLGQEEGPSDVHSRSWAGESDPRSARVPQVIPFGSVRGGSSALGDPATPPVFTVGRFAVQPGSKLVDPERDLRLSGAFDVGTAVRVSGPWTIGAARSLQRVRVFDQVRTRVQNRFGARTAPSRPSDTDRLGLDLSGGSPRGVIVELPVIAAQQQSVTAGQLAIYLRVEDWKRAAPGGDDPIEQIPAGADVSEAEREHGRYLPCVVAEGKCVRDVIETIAQWERVQEDSDGDFSTGSGPRFYFSRERGVLRVLLDRGGTLIAYSLN